MSRLGPIALTVLTGLMVSSGRVAAQEPSVPPAFEVASIKPNNSGDRGRRIGFLGDRLQAINMTVKELISSAYGVAGLPSQPVPQHLIVGGPDWINSVRFDVEAKATRDVPIGMAGAGQKLLMLRTTLAERFKLILHTETKEGPIYALTLSRRDGQMGPRLQRSQLDCTANRNTGRPPPPPGSPAAGGRRTCGFGANLLFGTIVGGGITMADLAYLLSTVVDRAVVDRSGLTGQFDVDLQFSPEGLRDVSAARDVDRPVNDSPSIFTAVEERFGLKLESARGPVDVLVIDHVERPTED